VRLQPNGSGPIVGPLFLRDAIEDAS
jgi:hypothetical protein